ncbi:MAG: hypothetical protein RLZZ338_3148, partial [Cyanobacteriota bacterium]
RLRQVSRLRQASHHLRVCRLRQASRLRLPLPVEDKREWWC